MLTVVLYIICQTEFIFCCARQVTLTSSDRLIVRVTYFFTAIVFISVLHTEIYKIRDASENINWLWLLVIADQVRYMVYAVIMDDCRRPDLGFTATVQQPATLNTLALSYNYQHFWKIKTMLAFRPPPFPKIDKRHDFLHIFMILLWLQILQVINQFVKK